MEERVDDLRELREAWAGAQVCSRERTSMASESREESVDDLRESRETCSRSLTSLASLTGAMIGNTSGVLVNEGATGDGAMSHDIEGATGDGAMSHDIEGATGDGVNVGAATSCGAVMGMGIIG